MHANKLLIGFLVALACGLVAAGCGGNDDDEGSSETATEQDSSNGAQVPTTIDEVPTSPEELGFDSSEEAIAECRRRAEELPADNLRDLAHRACDQGEEVLEQSGAS